jgi:exopolyphosphatase/guanosine-5'-triphosphate,3'-diphosphate pyrophosphatase
MTRVAAVDLGTNSTRLLVADVEDGRVDELDRETVITRLGEGVDRRRRLLPVPIARVRNTLVDFRRRAEELGAERTLLVATSAVRDAENGEAFLVGRELEPGTLLLDVGGGSTELTLPDFRISLDVGSVRLTERFLASDPPTADELEACRAAVHSVLEEHAADLDVRQAIGVAGTITTIAALELGGYDRDRVHGYRIAREAAERQLERLAALPLEERRRLPGLEPARAPVIVAGAAIVVEVLRCFDLDELEVSENDILTGAALAAAELPEREEGDAPPGAYTCC